MQLTDIQFALVIGTVLGDGCLERNGNHIRFRIDHGSEQKQYVLWKYKLLKNLVSKIPREVEYFHEKHDKLYTSVRFSTRSLASLDYFHEIFYISGKKKVPDSIADLLIHPLSLAVWLMDDGYKRNDCNAFRFNTDMFERKELRYLCDALFHNFGIECTLHKKGKYWNIYIPQKSAHKFVDIVRPYIIPSMLYKITLAP
jgi:hypothetical protein